MKKKQRPMVCSMDEVLTETFYSHCREVVIVERMSLESFIIFNPC